MGRSVASAPATVVSGTKPGASVKSHGLFVGPLSHGYQTDACTAFEPRRWSSAPPTGRPT